MDILPKIEKKIQELKIPYDSIMLSPKHNKKIGIVVNGKAIDFGAKNSVTYLEKRDDNKRNGFRKRFNKIYLKNGKRAIDVPYSPAWLSYWLLW